MGTYAGAAAQDSERLAAGRAWVRWGIAAAVTGMLAWVIGFALIPPDAKLEKGEQHLVQVARAHTGQGYAAALLTVLGAVLLVAFFAVLTRLVPEGSPGRVCCACPWPGACSPTPWWPSAHRSGWLACPPQPGMPGPSWSRCARGGSG